MRKTNKEELNKLKQACLEKANVFAEKYPTRKFSTWDIIANVLAESSGYPVYFLTLKADIDIIRLIAEGLSVSSIANRMSISSQHIYYVAKTWGLTVLDSTLDFNPMYIYHRGMSIQDMIWSINEILPIPISKEDAKIIINNIERYYDLQDFIEEFDYEKG